MTEFGEKEYREILQLIGVSMSRTMAEKVWRAQQSKTPVVVGTTPELSPAEFRRWLQAATPEEADAILLQQASESR